MSCNTCPMYTGVLLMALTILALAQGAIPAKLRPGTCCGVMVNGYTPYHLSLETIRLHFVWPPYSLFISIQWIHVKHFP